MIREGENIKLKNHLKKVFENEDFVVYSLKN